MSREILLELLGLLEQLDMPITISHREVTLGEFKFDFACLTPEEALARFTILANVYYKDRLNYGWLYKHHEQTSAQKKNEANP